MSDNESYDEYSVDDETQLQPGDTLDDRYRGVEDILDEGWSPPERPRGVNAFGTTAAEQHQGESLEQRMAQEEPDPSAYFDDPLADPDTVGGDDPDALESDLIAGDVGIDGGAASAEEAAMHVVDES